MRQLLPRAANHRTLHEKGKSMNQAARKTNKDFIMSPKESIFLEEAYETLQRLSADDIKRLEYEAREKALRDHNSFVGSARRQGERNGIELAKKVFKLQAQGKTEEEIASECRMDVEKVREILE